MAVTGPNTNFTISGGGDLGNRYVSKDYLLDVYPNLVPGRNSPGLYGWGFQTSTNGGFVLGLGDANHRSSPTQIGSLSNWKMASTGDLHTMAVKTDGTLWGWGADVSSRGAFGVVANLNGSYSTPVQLGSDTNWKFVKAARFLSMGLKNDGSLWGTGINSSGQLGIGNSFPLNVSSWTQVGSDTNWKMFDYGEYCGYAIRNNGTLWAWGHTYGTGELGLGDGNHRSSPTQIGSGTDWKQVSAGDRFGMAIKTDGTLWAWGHNTSGQLGLGDIVHRSSPVQIGSLTNWKQVVCGSRHVLAIKNDGTLWAWGLNTQCQLGDVTTVSKSSPVQIGSLTNWKIISGGSKAIKTDGTLWSWGPGSGGSIGDGTALTRSSPIQIGTETTWKSLSSDAYSGDNTIFAIKDGYI